MTQFPTPSRSRNSQTFRQVAAFWEYLTHPNIVPVPGIIIDSPQLITNRMLSGDPTLFIVSHPEADRMSLVSNLSVLLDETLTPLLDFG